MEANAGERVEAADFDYARLVHQLNCHGLVGSVTRVGPAGGRAHARDILLQRQDSVRLAVMALTDSEIDEAVARYERELDRFQKLVDFVADVARSVVRENAIPATVQGRVKDPGRLRGKLIKKRDMYASVDGVFSGLKDFAGVRVATYVESDRARVVSELAQRFGGSGGGVVAPDVRDLSCPSFYRATHCQVVLLPDDLSGRNSNLEGASCEIQVCSLMAHVWNELEHDLLYKPMSGDLGPDEKASLTNVGHLVRAGDGAIRALLEATDRRLNDIQGPYLDQWDFVARTRKRFPSSTEFGTHSGQLFDEICASGITSPGELEDRLLGEDPEGAVKRSREILDNLSRALAERNDDVVRLNELSSDPLLMLYLEKFADDVLERHPTGRGRGRPSRITSAASRFKELI